MSEHPTFTHGSGCEWRMGHDCTCGLGNIVARPALPGDGMASRGSGDFKAPGTEAAANGAGEVLVSFCAAPGCGGLSAATMDQRGPYCPRHQQEAIRLADIERREIEQRSALGSPLTRATVLDAARDCVLRDRDATHGQPQDAFGAIAAVWSARLGIEITPAQVAILMADVKTCRAWGNPAHGDNWIDLAGYAACGGELAGAQA